MDAERGMNPRVRAAHGRDVGRGGAPTLRARLSVSERDPARLCASSTCPGSSNSRGPTRPPAPQRPPLDRNPLDQPPDHYHGGGANAERRRSAPRLTFKQCPTGDLPVAACNVAASISVGIRRSARAYS